MAITGFGHYAPDHIVTNDYLAKIGGRDNEWIERRTGIRERRYAAPDQATSDLACRSISYAICDSGLEHRDIGLLILATSTPDYLVPPTAPAVASALGLEGVAAFDLAGGCSGFLYALSLAIPQARASNKAVVVCGANTMSRRVLTTDLGSASIFGDGAGAVIVTPDTHSTETLVAQSLTSAGALADLVRVEKGGSRNPIKKGEVIDDSYFVGFASSATAFKAAVKCKVDTARECLDISGFGIADIDWWIPHQSNARIIEAAAKQLGVPLEKIALTIEQFGNTSAASIPFTLSYYRSAGLIKKNQLLLFTAAGSGFLAGSILIRI